MAPRSTAKSPDWYPVADGRTARYLGIVCASEHRLTYEAPATAVVAGALVDGVQMPASDIAAAVIDKLKE